MIPLLIYFLLSSPGSMEAQRFGWDEERLVERDIFPGNAFTFCRAQYSGDRGRRGSGRRRGRGRGGWGGSWRVDYPQSDQNFSLRLSQLTTLNISKDEDGEFVHAIAKLDEPDLFKYPFIYMLEVGGMSLSLAEQEGLRAYLLRGGFLLVDDFWGDYAWENWQVEISQVLPPEEYPMVDIPLDHELFHIVFDLDEVPQVPGIRSWEWSGDSLEGDYSRYTTYGPEAHCKGIFDHNGRLMVVVMHNTDLGDGWEREGEHIDYFREYSAKLAYPMGINIVVYAMTH
jgi:hypothetical protein